MQVFGLPRQVIRGARVASRVAAQPTKSAAAVRDAVVARWRQAMRDGLSAGRAAAAVGVSRATLYRWARRSMPRSRRPHHVRKKNWPSALVAAVERLRLDFPMWGKAKLVVLLAREGFLASEATVGRILKHLVERGVVTPVPVLRRRPRPWSRKRRYAVR